MTCGPFRPSKLNRGSYFPGPQELKTALVVASSAGDRATIAPTLRSRLGQPSEIEKGSMVTRRWSRELEGDFIGHCPQQPAGGGDADGPCSSSSQLSLRTFPHTGSISKRQTSSPRAQHERS